MPWTKTAMRACDSGTVGYPAGFLAPPRGHKAGPIPLGLAWNGPQAAAAIGKLAELTIQPHIKDAAFDDSFRTGAQCFRTMGFGMSATTNTGKFRRRNLSVAPRG
jgi:hypothetical protein